MFVRNGTGEATTPASGAKGRRQAATGDGVLRSPNSNCNALYFIKTIDFLDPPGTLCLAILRLSRVGREALGQSAWVWTSPSHPSPRRARATGLGLGRRVPNSARFGHAAPPVLPFPLLPSRPFRRSPSPPSRVRRRVWRRRTPKPESGPGCKRRRRPGDSPSRRGNHCRSST